MSCADVVSVASPGSSDGGSAPMATLRTCALALLASPLPVVAADVPTTLTARSPASPAQTKRLSILTYPSLIRDPSLSPTKPARLRPPAEKGLDLSLMRFKSPVPVEGAAKRPHQRVLPGAYLLP